MRKVLPALAFQDADKVLLFRRTKGHHREVYVLVIPQSCIAVGATEEWRIQWLGHVLSGERDASLAGGAPHVAIAPTVKCKPLFGGPLAIDAMLLP